MKSSHPGVIISAQRLLLCGLVAILCVGSACAAEESNVLRNSSFETEEDGRPAGWRTQTWSGAGEFRLVDGGRTGGRCAMIESAPGGDLSWTTTAAVEPNSTYRLSGWIRAEDLQAGTGRGAQLNVHETQRAAVTPAVTGSSDWTRVEAILRTGDLREVTVNCLFGGWGLSQGRAWFDDVRLEKLDLANFRPAVTVQADRTATAINPFIYGQFIEHLGRCIYGGIWAEMLEDRKFYFPVTAQYRPYRSLEDTPFPVVGASPWQIMGAADSVQMVREDSFVGQHTPQIAADSGIRQRDLGVVQGKAYEGYIWLRSAAGGAPQVRVSLVWGDAQNARQTVELRDVGAEYARHPLQFTAGAGTDTALLEVQVDGGPVLIGTISLMPADNIRGMRADTLALLKQLNAPMYRWPGGNFVSGYDWRDGIGDRDRRPPRKNPAWTGVEHNDFGLDEYIDFCRELQTEPVIAANTGLGDAYSAAQEVEYCNGSPTTLAGGWRAKNGHAEPYGVKYWCVGNEMWGPWQLGFMQLRHYTIKHNEVADAMWAMDPSLQLIGCGQLGVINREFDTNEKRDWTRGMLEQCADYMDYISEHFYHDKNRENLLAHVNQLANSIREKADGHRRLQQELGLLDKQPVPIAMDEWNYWHQPYVYGELGCIYDLSDALGVAIGLHEYFRQTDIIHMAHYAQTVNVIGCIKTTKTDAFFDATALPLLLYRREFGTLPIQLQGDHALAGLDISAAWTADRQAVTIAMVNPNREARTLTLNVLGADLAAEGRAWVIRGDDPGVINEPGQPRLQIVEQTMRCDGPVRLEPLSITLVRLPAR